MPSVTRRQTARPAFRDLAALARRLDVAELSMGMSADLEVAVQEGATIIRVGEALFGIAVTPDGKTAYAADTANSTVIPINLATKAPGTPINVGQLPGGVAISPDGKTVYVTNYGDGTVTPIDVATNTPGAPIHVGKHPNGIAITH